MTVSQIVTVLLDIVFLGILGYGVYLLQLGASLQRKQVAQLSDALIQAVQRAQNNSEVSASTAGKLSEIVAKLYAEVTSSESTTTTTQSNNPTTIPAMRIVVDVKPVVEVKVRPVEDDEADEPAPTEPAPPSSSAEGGGESV